MLILYASQLSNVVCHLDLYRFCNHFFTHGRKIVNKGLRNFEKSSKIANDLEYHKNNPIIFFLGEEGRGGEDQDLDEIVIRQLREENEKLKDELQMLREVTASDSSIHEELSAILRDRINDLLVANSDLEKEVVRLRYSPKEVIIMQFFNC